MVSLILGKVRSVGNQLLCLTGHLLPLAFCKMSEVMFRLSEAISLRQGYRLDHTVGEASTFLAAHEYRSAGNR